MESEYFVDELSIVRQIWGKSDTILFIFAGASAEFALNKAVDWLYFTGRLPEDPIGRLFSTVSYARKIVFSEEQMAKKAIDTMVKIHDGVEKKRNAKIPDWAYRDVLFMLIDYSIRSFELLERQLTFNEKQEVFNVFYRVGCGMRLKGLPESFEAWEKMRNKHLHENLKYTHYSHDLFKQYRIHLGAIRYKVLQETQKLLVPEIVNELIGFNKFYPMNPLIKLYKLSKIIKIDWIFKALLLPSKYKMEFKALDRLSSIKINKTSY